VEQSVRTTSHSLEQTGLFHRKSRVNVTTRVDEKGGKAHKDQGGVQDPAVLLHEAAVVLVGYALELGVEADAGVTSRPKEVGKESWECFEHGILQTENEKRDQEGLETEEVELTGRTLLD
jgi:hypothetical protein